MLNKVVPKKTIKNILIVAVVVFASLSVIFYCVNSRIQADELYTSCSTDYVTENEELDYDCCLQVVDRKKKNTWTRELWLIKTDNSDRGYPLFFSSRSFIWDKKQEMDLNIRWEKDGLRFVFNNAEVFVPKDKLLTIKNP